MNANEVEPDIKAIVDDAVISAFEAVLQFQMKESITDGPPFNRSEQIIGMVGIAGPTQGTICLRTDSGFAQLATAAMLGLPPGEVFSDADVNDVIGELTNIIAGKIKGHLKRDNQISNLSLPTIVRSASRVELESIRGVKHFLFTFTYESNPLVLEVYTVRNEETVEKGVPKILLIDDSKATRTIVSRILLGAFRCEILEAVNGIIGLEMARIHHPSLIVLDMTMPLMDGVETLRRLRAQANTRNTPTIILSANAHSEGFEIMKRLGATHYVTKTQKPTVIADLVRQCIVIDPKETPAATA
jgi:CheY-like chemotaxis protein